MCAPTSACLCPISMIECTPFLSPDNAKHRYCKCDVVAYDISVSCCQADYEREGIDWSYIEFVDNQDVLQLLEGKLGVLELLDEQCRFPTATHRDLAEKLYSGTATSASRRFSKPKKSITAFTVEHYAGPVTYQTDNFLEKNRDYVVAEHQLLLQGSACGLVAELFSNQEQNGKASVSVGVNYLFARQLVGSFALRGHLCGHLFEVADAAISLKRVLCLFTKSIIL